MASTPMTVDQVLAANLRALRKERGLTQDAMADLIRSQGLGLRWDRATLAAVETGRRRVSLEEVVLCQFSYRRPLTELLSTRFADASAVVNARGAIPAAIHEEVLRGAEVTPELMEEAEAALTADLGEFVRESVAAEAPKVARRYKVDAGALLDEAVRYSLSDAESRVHRRLEKDGYQITPVPIVAAAISLWGCSLTPQREKVLNDSGSAQTRGQRARISAELMAALRAHVRAVEGRSISRKKRRRSTS